MDKKETGQNGEKIAKDYLTEKGYNLIEENWVIGRLEIDLILEKGDELIFVEVKARKSKFLGSPDIWVNKAKQNNLLKAAQIFINKKQIEKEARFDVISVIFNDDNHNIEHIPGAFGPRW
ncbi:MAG: YraN family protein [Flavobacteriales bacterium]